MGYVEDIQKINKLAKELQQHGMASSLDEACERARDILTKQSSEAAPEEQGTVDWQVAMSKNNEFIVKQFHEFKKQIGSIVSEIQEIRKELHRSRAPPVQVKQQEINIVEPSPIQAKLEVARADDSHPKQGEFSSEDVAIDKVFYFGNK